MKKVLLTALFMGLILNFASAQGNFNSANDGDWTDATTWGTTPGLGAGTTYPGTGDNVNVNGHNITYDLVGSQTVYGNIQFNSGSFNIPGGGVTPTIVRTNRQFTLNIPLTLGTNARFAVASSGLNLNSGGSIDFADRTSIFSVQDSTGSGANLQINSTISVTKGIFAIISTGGTINITVNGGGGINIGTNGALALEGNGGNANFNDANCIVVEEYAEVITDFTSSVNVTLNNADAIVFESGSSLYRKNIGATWNNNNPKYQVQLSGNAGWRHISSPFTTGTTLSTLDGTDFNPMYSPAAAKNIYRWDASPFSGSDANGWTVSNSNTDIFEAGDSYNIYTGGTNYPFSNGGLIEFTQPVTASGDHTFTLYNTIDTATNPGIATEGDQGWNMIGNPYCTWLDLEEFLTDEMAPSNEYQGAHVWSVSAQNYLAYLAGGETLEETHEITGGSVTSGGTRVIRPFQAFWVKMSSTSPNGTSMQVTIDTSHRSQNPLLVSPNYFSSAFIPRLRLNAYAASDSAWDQVLITMNPNSSKLRLGNEDAFDRASANDRPNMALIHEDGERLCIDSRPLDSTTVFPLVFEQGVDAATYYISMVDDQFDASMSAYLEDLKTNTLHDLENGAYSFTHDKSYATNRFNIHLAPSFVSQSELKLAKNNFQIWTANDKLFIQLDEAGINQNLTIEVYDLSGKLVFGTSASAENTNTSIPLQLSAGAHIIKVNHPQYGSQVLKTIR